MAKKIVLSANALAEEVARRTNQRKWPLYRPINAFIETEGKHDALTPAVKQVMREIIQERMSDMQGFIDKLFK